MDFGTLARDGDEVELRYELTFERPVETLWAALTEPARLDDWISPAFVEPFVGGRYELFIDRDPHNQMHGRILSWDPPRLLEYSWFESGAARGKVRAELYPHGKDGSRLVFVHTNMPERFADGMAPGWHLLLERLAAAVAGSPVAKDWDAWRELRKEYAARYGFEIAAG
jgi:uncharacterized protein YndB with AHSA1/START domain